MSSQIAASLPAARRVNRTLVVLTLVEAILLFLGTSSLIGRIVAPLTRIGASPLYVLLSLIGIASFVLPSLIGFLCRAWHAAIVLPIGAWWLALVAHAVAASVAVRIAEIPSLYPGPLGSPHYTPFWLNLSATAALLLSFALFGALGFLGWLARRALGGER